MIPNLMRYRENESVGINFPSAEWVSAFCDAINSNPGYAEAGKEWTHGRVSYIVEADPTLGLEKKIGMVLDLHEGVCRNAALVAAEEAENAEFVIVANYGQWKDVLSGEIDPTKAMMQMKLRLQKGHLPTIIRFVNASKELVRSAEKIDTEYLA